MTLSLFDQQLFEKVVSEKYPDKKEFSKTEIILLLNEMTKAEKYYPKGGIVKGAKHKVFKYFVRYCLYRNLANFDTMILLSGSKGCKFLDEKIKTPGGDFSFRDLKLDDEDIFDVVSYDFEKKKEVWSRARYFNTGKQRTYSLELEDGRSVIATKNHTFFVRRNKKIIEVMMKDIRLTDEGVTTSNHQLDFTKINHIKYSGWKPTCDLNIPKYHNYIMSNGIISHNSGKSSFGIMLCKEWCGLLGISFNPKLHIAYTNAQVQERIDNLPRFSPLQADESINFSCLVGNSEVITLLGKQQIKDLVNQKDFEVLSYSNKKVFKKALRCIYTKKDIVYELETIDGKKIKCTKEHLFKTKKGYVKLSDLSKGDYVATI